jgi:hypothetical protein
LSRAGIWAAVLAGAVGCATAIEVDDTGVYFPTLRASKRLGDEWILGAIADYAQGSGTTAGSTGSPILIDGASPSTSTSTSRCFASKDGCGTTFPRSGSSTASSARRSTTRT